MYKRIVVVVAAALFGLLSLVATIVVDLYDREFPQAIDTQSRLSLDFSDAALDDHEARASLADLDSRLGLGLVKVAPERDGDGQVFVALHDDGFPAEFHRFGDDEADEIVGPERLAHSPPDGTYLVTGDPAGIDTLEYTLADAGVEINRNDASVLDSFTFVATEASFGAAVLAAFALIAALALFWLSMRARARALRVLGGCPTVRIQVEDLGGFLVALLAPAIVVATVATIAIGLTHGWVHAVPFLTTLAGLQVAVIGASLLAALAMSLTTWPSATMLATRQPAVKSLRSAAVVVQALTFLLVVAAAGPAWAAYQESSSRADDLAQWRKLDDQVALEFAVSGPNQEPTAIEPKIGELVRDAESRDSVALSYTFTEERWNASLGDYSAVAFVNQRWLDLFEAPDRPLTPVPFDQVESTVDDAFSEQWELLARSDAPGEELLSQMQYHTPADGSRFPVTTGNGDLLFRDDILLAVVPSLHGAINDQSLTAMVSTEHILFTGVTQTQDLLEQHGLSAPQLRAAGHEGELRVVRIAEQGILLSQFATYVQWLLNLALVALAVAFALAAAISAVITAHRQARRDFPLRLAGWSWPEILRPRLARELLVGAGLVAVVLLLQRPDGLGAVSAAAAFGLLVVPLSHLVAVRRSFLALAQRRT